MNKYKGIFAIIALSSFVLCLLIAGVISTAVLVLTPQEFVSSFYSPLLICFLWTGIICIISLLITGLLD